LQKILATRTRGRNTDVSRSLDINEVVEKYKRSSRRVILLDYGSAYAPHSLVGNLMVHH
jgi:hypothetical protein